MTSCAEPYVIWFAMKIFPPPKLLTFFTQQQCLSYLTSHRVANWTQLQFSFDCYRIASEKKKNKENSTMQLQPAQILAILKKINHRKVGVYSIGMILFSVLFCMVVLPTLIMFILRKVKNQKKNYFEAICGIDFHLIIICSFS